MGDINNSNDQDQIENNPSSTQSQNQQPLDQQQQNQQPYEQQHQQQYQYDQYQQNNPYQSQNQYQQYQPYQQYERPQKNNGMAIGSMVCGIISFIFSCCLWYISLPLAIVSIVLGIIVLRKKKDGRGMAIAGIILSGVSIVIAILVIVAVTSLMGNEEFMNYYREIYRGIESEY